MDDRNLLLRVGLREAVVVDAARVEEAAVAFASDVELRDAFGQAGAQRIDAALIGRQRVVLEIGGVARHDAVPAPKPLFVERELAGGFERAAPVAIAWRRGAALA